MMGYKQLKECSDEEIAEMVKRSLVEIREGVSQYGVIRITISGGKVKFFTVEKPMVVIQG